MNMHAGAALVNRDWRVVVHILSSFEVALKFRLCSTELLEGSGDLDMSYSAH